MRTGSWRVLRKGSGMTRRLLAPGGPGTKPPSPPWTRLRERAVLSEGPGQGGGLLQVQCCPEGTRSRWTVTGAGTLGSGGRHRGSGPPAGLRVPFPGCSPFWHGGLRPSWVRLVGTCTMPSERPLDPAAWADTRQAPSARPAGLRPRLRQEQQGHEPDEDCLAHSRLDTRGWRGTK